VLLGNGDGTFTTVPSSPATDATPVSIVASDFNGDGIPDLAVANMAGENSPGTVTVLLGNGDGTFTPVSASSSTGEGPAAMVAGDFNGDGIPDLAVVNTTSGSVTILLGNGDGTFTATAVSPTTGSGPRRIVAADFNGDGILDLAVTNSLSNTVTVLLGNGDGTFAATAVSPPAGTTPTEIAAADFNGDGIPDLAIVDTASSTLQVLQGDGHGGFTAVPNSTVSAGLDPSSMTVGDFNGDGIADLALANGPTTGPSFAIVLKGTGTGTFSLVQPPSTSGHPMFIVAADFTGAGHSGLAVANQASNTITILEPEWDATESQVSYYIPPTGSGNHAVEASYSGDSNYSSSVSAPVTLTSPGTPTTLILTASTTSISYGQPVTLTATLSPYTSGNNTSNGETVTFYNAQTGMLPIGTATLSAGVATLIVSTLPTGDYNNVYATYGGDQYRANSGSNELQIIVGGTGLTLTVSPNSTTAGQPVTMTAKLSPYTSGTHSTNGEIVLFYVGVSNGPQFTFQGTLSGGVATVTTSVIPAGYYTGSTGSTSPTVISASYPGDAYLAPSNATLTGFDFLTVSPAKPALALSVNPVNSVLGQAVALTATLSADFALTANGETVTFLSNNRIIGTGAIASGVATLSTSSLPAGVNDLTATYPGDPNNSPAFSNITLESVTTSGQSTPSMTLAVTGSGGAVTSVASSTPVTLTAAVTAAGAPVAPGTVIFCDVASGGTCSGLGLLGAAQLTSGGTAAITLRLGIGSHLLAAIFSGNSANSPIFSSASPLTVKGLYSSISSFTATSQTNGGYLIQEVVQGTAPGSAPYPSGTVQFIDQSFENVVLGTGTLTPSFYSQGSFFSAGKTPATGSKPFSIAAQDFNHDGIPDLAVANSGDGTISILLGIGDGTYQAQTTYKTGSGAYSVAVGDFNGDGNPDLAVANFSSNTVSILLGNGDGTFQTQKTYATGSAPNSVAVGDFNGDGNLDLAIANSIDGTVSILLGKGDGTFLAQQTYATGNGPASVAVGDFNSDGIADLAVANNGDDTVSILLGVGDGSFSTEVPYQAGSQPISVTTGDFNADGNLDVAVANLSGGVSEFLGNGDGTFQSQLTLAAGSGPYDVVSGNFSGKGYVDLAVANSVSNTLTLFLNDGKGNFTTRNPGAAGAGPISLAAADLNGDGMTDLAVLNNSGDTVTALLNRSGPQSAAYAYIQVPGTNPYVPGTNQVVGQYSGDAIYGAENTHPVTLTSSRIATSMTIGSSANTSNYGSPLTLTATLTAQTNQYFNTNGDAVTFLSGTTVLGTATLAAGVATITTTALPVGIDAVQATFAGNSNFIPASSGVLSVTVRPAALIVTGSNVSRPYGSPNPALTGTVSGAVNGNTFTITGTTTANPASPLGAYTVVPSVTGSHLSDYTVTKVNGTLTVTRATPTNVLTSSANPAFVSNPVTFTATLSAVGVTPTGDVSFYDGTTLLGTGTLNSGIATYSTSSLGAGSHSITAVYPGASELTAVTSSALTEKIESFALSAQSGSSSVTASPGGQAVYTFAVAPPSGTTFPDAIAFSVAGLPSGATATFSPATVAAGSGATNVTLTVTLPSQTALQAPHKPLNRDPWTVALGLILLPLIGRLRGKGKGLRAMVWFPILCLAGASIALGLNACGGGSGGGGGTTTTPPQTYTLTISAISGKLSNTATVTLIVE
jgi:hypothetical protein